MRLDVEDVYKRQREGSGDILYLALRVLNPQNQHMLSHPSFILPLIGSNAQSKAFFTQQHIAAVTGVDGPNGICLLYTSRCV